jgi:glycosyltransferase involved in cell wall biosynthesis
MRILLAHNKYQQPGGEDVVFDQEAKLLSESGHDINKFVVSNESIEGLISKADAFLNILENRRIVEEFAERVSSFKPDIVHFHNFFPRLSPGAVSYVLERKIPTLQTLHNFRHVCANGMFLRHNSICQLCLNKPMRIPALIHRCYRHSSLATFAVTRVGRRFRQLFDSHPDHLTLVALTKFARKQMIDDGYSPDRILTKPNSVPDAGAGPHMRDRRVLFVGRLSVEKGADFLIHLANSIDATFEIIGDGPEAERLRTSAPSNVVFRGRLDHHDVLERIKTAAVVAVPSRWFEGFPMIVAEAFSAGTPVIASRIGSLAEIVEDDISGITVEPDNHQSWKQAIERILNDPLLARSLGHGARLAFEGNYTSQHNLRCLVGIYSGAIERAARSVPGDRGSTGDATQSLTTRSN